MNELTASFLSANHSFFRVTNPIHSFRAFMYILTDVISSGLLYSIKAIL